MIQSVQTTYLRSIDGLAQWLGPVVLLLLRVWVALAFWHAGVVKLDDPAGTQYLFASVYHVPLLPPAFAAVLATWVELIVPWLLGLGVFGRLVAVFLFVYNIIAFVSFPALWPHGFWHDLFGTTAFADHKIWGIMLLAIIAFGPGRLSLDALARFTWRRVRKHSLTTDLPQSPARRVVCELCAR